MWKSSEGGLLSVSLHCSSLVAGADTAKCLSGARAMWPKAQHAGTRRPSVGIGVGAGMVWCLGLS